MVVVKSKDVRDKMETEIPVGDYLNNSGGEMLVVQSRQQEQK
jgi:hypothetical protein